MDNETKILLGSYCKEFRINILGESLTGFSNKINENLKNINAFESGRANNIKYIFYYANFNLDKREDFIKGLFNIL